MPEAVTAILDETRAALAKHRRVLLIVGDTQDEMDHRLIESKLLDEFRDMEIPVTLAMQMPANYTARYLRAKGFSTGRTNKILKRLTAADTDGYIRADGIFAEDMYKRVDCLPLATAMSNGQPIMYVDAAIPQTGHVSQVPLDNPRTHDMALRLNVPMDTPILPSESRGMRLRNALMFEDVSKRLRTAYIRNHVVMLVVSKAHIGGTAKPFANLGMIVPAAIAGKEAPYHQSLHSLAVQANLPVVAAQLGGYTDYPTNMPARLPAINVCGETDTDRLVGELGLSQLFDPVFKDNAGKTFDAAVKDANRSAPVRFVRKWLPGKRPS